MNFLFPAFLLSAIAIAIPIVLHFRRQPPQKTVPFSSLMFLEQTPVVPRTRRKLEDWLLLLLRCLALLLLALMFARPFLHSASQTTAASGTRWCVLVDTSASMQRPEAWQQAEKRFREIVSGIKEDDTAMLATFDRVPRVLVSTETWRATAPGARVALLNNAWKEVKPTWGATDLGKALLFAAEQLSGGQIATTAKAKVMLISDIQEGASLEALHSGAWPEGISVTPHIITAPWQDNFTLSPAASLALEDAAEVPQTGASNGAATTLMRVRVTSSRDAKQEKFTLGWQEGGERVEATIPPGGSRMLPAPERVKPDTDGLLELRGDKLDFDNRIHVARPRAREVRVLCLGDNLSRTDVGSPLFYLVKALSPTPSFQPRLAEKPMAQLTAADLSQAQLVFTFGPAQEAQAKLLRTWVAEGPGHALLCVPGVKDDPSLIRTLLADTAASLNEASGDALLQDLRFEHPLLRAFAESGVRDFSRIRFWKHRTLTLPESIMKQSTVLARFDDGSVAWADLPAGKGRVMYLGSGWAPADSQLAVSSKFVPLVFGLIDWALGDISSQRGGVVGDVITAQLGHWQGNVPVVRPDGKSVNWDSTAQPAYADTDLPGIYRIGTGEEERSIAVNLAASEGRLAPMDVQRLAEVGVKLDKAQSAEAAAADTVAQHRLEDAQHEQRQKVWKMLLLAALTVLLAETWVAGRRGRGMAVEGVA